MLTNLKKIGVSAMLLAPYMVLAVVDDAAIATTLGKVLAWVGLLGQIVVALVFVYFIWGLISYLIGGSEKKEEARGQMIYSILILFVIFSIWGIIGLLGSLTGTGGGTTIDVDIPKTTI